MMQFVWQPYRNDAINAPSSTAAVPYGATTPQQYHYPMHRYLEQQFPTPSAQPNEELYWSPRGEQWRPFQWDQQPPQQQLARMSVDATGIHHGSRSRESRERRSVDCSSSSGISRGLLCTYDFVIDDAQSTQRAAPLCEFDLNEEASNEEVPVQEVPMHRAPNWYFV